MSSKIPSLRDERTFAFGEIWSIKDKLVSFPATDTEIVKDTFKERNMHVSRPVIIAQNCESNNDPNDEIIQVIPLTSSTTNKRKHDVLLDPAVDGVMKHSLALCNLLQPVLKIDLYDCINEIGEDSKDNILAILVTRLGMDLEEDD